MLKTMIKSTLLHIFLMIATLGFVIRKFSNYMINSGISMKIFSVKKYFAIFLLALAGMSGSVSIDAAAVKLIQGFPYKPLWDLAVLTKKQGIEHVSNALMKPPVVYYAVPGTVAYAVWAYCELASWMLEREKHAVQREIDGVSWDLNKKRLSQNDTQELKTVLDRRRMLLPQFEARAWRLWFVKWISLGLGSLAFMMTYKVWPKDTMTN